jgi:hypothetical protein
MVEAERVAAGLYDPDALAVRLSDLSQPLGTHRLSMTFAGLYDDQWADVEPGYSEASWGVCGHAVPGREPLRPET